MRGIIDLVGLSRVSVFERRHDHDDVTSRGICEGGCTCHRRNRRSWPLACSPNWRKRMISTAPSRLRGKNLRASLGKPSPITVRAARRNWIRTLYEFLHNEGFP